MLIILGLLTFYINFRIILFTFISNLLAFSLGFYWIDILSWDDWHSWQHWIFLTLNMVFPQYWRNCLQWGRETWVPSLWLRKTLRRAWPPTPEFLVENSMDRGAVGYSPWGIKELDTTEWLTFTSLHFQPWIWNIFPFI